MHLKYFLLFDWVLNFAFSEYFNLDMFAGQFSDNLASSNAMSVNIEVTDG